MKKNNKFIGFAIIIGTVLFILLLVLFNKKGYPMLGEIIEESLPESVQENVPQVVFSRPANERIYSYVELIFKHLNNKNYSELYGLLNPEYISYKYNNSFENFKSHIESYMKDTYSPNFKKFAYKDGRYIIFTEFLKTNYTKEDLLSARTILSDTLVINEKAEDDFSFAFEGFLSSKSIYDKEIVINDVVLTPKSITYLKDSGECIFEIRNNGKEPVEFDIYNCYLKTYYGYEKHKMSVVNKTLNRSEYIEITIPFDYDINGLDYIEKIIIKDIQKGEEKFSIETKIDKR